MAAGAQACASAAHCRTLTWRPLMRAEQRAAAVRLRELQRRDSESCCGETGGPPTLPIPC